MPESTLQPPCPRLISCTYDTITPRRRDVNSGPEADGSRWGGYRLGHGIDHRKYHQDVTLISPENTRLLQ